MEKTEVLMVDDELGILEILSEEITSRGLKILTSQDGREALELIQKTKPKVIISDYSMPGLNGLELLRFLRDLGISIPVIWLTGVASRKIILEAWRLGVYDFFEKPFRAEEVAEQVLIACSLLPEDLLARRPRFLTEVYFKNIEVDLDVALFKKLQDVCLKDSVSMSRYIAQLVESAVQTQATK